MDDRPAWLFEVNGQCPSGAYWAEVWIRILEHPFNPNDALPLILRRLMMPGWIVVEGVMPAHRFLCWLQSVPGWDGPGRRAGAEHPVRITREPDQPGE